MRVLLIVMLFALTSQAAEPFHEEADIFVRLEMGSDTGTFEKNGESAAYSTSLYTLVVGFEDKETADTLFGTKVRLHADLLFAYQTADERVADPDADARLRLSTGVLWSIYETPSFDVSLRSAFDYWIVRPDFDGMAFNLNLGLRGEYKKDLSFANFRLLAGYDIKPLWLGIDRMEHVFTARALLGYVGVRGTALFGNETHGGERYERREVGIAAEIVF